MRVLDMLCTILMCGCLLFAAGAPSSPQASLPPQQPQQTNAAQNTGSAPTPAPRSTRLRLMQSRYEQLLAAVDGYQRTGVPLVGFSRGRWLPTGYSDDIGIYYFAQLACRLLHLNPAASSDVVFALILFLCFGSGLWGTMLLLRGRLSRAIGVLALAALLTVTVVSGDVYLMQSAIVVAIVPWILFLCREAARVRGLGIAAFLAGLALSEANYIRFHSGTPVLIFLLVMLVFHLRAPRARKALLVGAMLAGFLLPVVHFRILVANRDALLQRREPGYRAAVPRHTFWHQVYIGLGYLNNDYGLKYQDAVAADKVRSIDPTAEYVSFEYERILRGEVVKLVKAHPRFMFETAIAKLGAVLVILLLSANVGLLFAVQYPKPWSLELAFWCPLAFSSLFGLLVTPKPRYLLGYISFAVLYSVVSIDHALECGVLKRLQRRSSAESCAGSLASSQQDPELQLRLASYPSFLQGPGVSSPSKLRARQVESLRNGRRSELRERSRDV